MAAKFEIRSAGAGQYTWVLLSQGRTLASGESYARRAAAEKAIASLRSAVAGATVADLTVKPKPAAAKAAKTAKAASTAKTARPAKTAKTARKSTAKTTTTTKATATTKAAGAPKKAAAPRKRVPRSA